MSTLQLPDRDSPELHLVEATAEELLEQQKAHYSEWGGALSQEAYLRREKLLFDQELTRDGNLTQWMLVHQPSAASAAKRLVVCGCESVKKRALVRRAGSKEIESVISYGIASVFCPPVFRGRGYAGRMMTEVANRLRDWHAHREPEAKVMFSILFSDIGKQFYAARGWQPFPSAHVDLPATTPQDAAQAKASSPNVRELHADDLAELCAIDEQCVRRRLVLHEPSRTAVALLPDHQTLVWHHRREEFVAGEILGRKPLIKGALVGENGARVWCCWTRVWTNPAEQAPNTLHILRLAIEDESFDDFEPASPEGMDKAKATRRDVTSHIAALFAAAQAEAGRWGLQRVQLWNPSSTALLAAQSLDQAAAVVHREDDSIASLLWYGDGSYRDVDWVCNEKYGWC